MPGCRAVMNVLALAMVSSGCGVPRPSERGEAPEHEAPNVGGAEGVSPGAGGAPGRDGARPDPERDARPAPEDSGGEDHRPPLDQRAPDGTSIREAAAPPPGTGGPGAGPLADEALPGPEAIRAVCKRTIPVTPGRLAPALKAAIAGDCLQLAGGIYDEGTYVTARDGTAQAPIVVMGPRTAVLKGRSRLLQIQHSHVWLYGFSVNGGAAPCSSSGANTLIYVQSMEAGKGVTGVRLLGLSLRDAKGECVRLKYLARGNEIGWNDIEGCGREDFGPRGEICAFRGTPCWDDPTTAACRSMKASKNGEGIYVGTAPEQSFCPPEIGGSCSPKNPSKVPDETRDNRIHHNRIRTYGNECVDVKEAATANVIEYNTCSGQGDPNSAGLDSRGDGNVFRYNDSSGNIGAGLRLGGDRHADTRLPLWGFRNQAYGNVFRDNRSGGIKFEAGDQGTICGNVMSGNRGGDAVGDTMAAYFKMYAPTAPCR